MVTYNAWAEEYLRVVDRMWGEEAYEEGRKVLESIFYEVPDYAKAHAYAAWYAENQLRDRKTAAKHYELAIHFDPSYGPVYLNYAEFLIESKDLERMTRLKAEGMKHPTVDKALLLNDYARMLELHERFSEAADVYKMAMRYTMNFWTMKTIKANRRRARSKYHLFAAIYSALI